MNLLVWLWSVRCNTTPANAIQCAMIHQMTINNVWKFITQQLVTLDRARVDYSPSSDLLSATHDACLVHHGEHWPQSRVSLLPSCPLVSAWVSNERHALVKQSNEYGALSLSLPPLAWCHLWHVQNFAPCFHLKNKLVGANWQYFVCFWMMLRPLVIGTHYVYVYCRMAFSVASEIWLFAVPAKWWRTNCLQAAIAAGN